eukprot:6177016-Pleurochrysis_carterae.AAC.3
MTTCERACVEKDCRCVDVYERVMSNNKNSRVVLDGLTHLYCISHARHTIGAAIGLAMNALSTRRVLSTRQHIA